MPLLSWPSNDEPLPELKFKQDIFGLLEKDNLLLIETPWYWLNQKEIEIKAIDWLSRSTNNKIVTESLYDPYPCELSTNIDESRHIRICTEDIPFWLLYVNKFFKFNSIENLQPREFTNLFLCYQRKPSIHRANLCRKLRGLKGFITYGGTNYNEVPNDISSVGDSRVWNTSLLNIVSETEYDPNYKVFLSEKTFKPIVGHRPFLIYGDIRTTEYLHELGFKTFEKYFGYTADNYKDQATQLSSIISNINNPQEVYQDLIEDLRFNYLHFPKVVNRVYENIKKLKEVL